MFDSSVRAFHEAGAAEILQCITGLEGGDERRRLLLECIRERDRLICPEVDSSQLNFYLIDILLAEYPDAKFLLTIRDCYTWLNSLMNHSLRFPATAPLWKKFRDYRFRADQLMHPPEEAALQARGLYTLQGYLVYWAKHNQGVIEGIPSDRLLIVKTAEITDRAHEIAQFAGLSPEVVKVDSLHAFRSDVDYRVLHELPPAYLDDMIAKYCGVLMGRFFPEIRSLADAGL